MLTRAARWGLLLVSAALVLLPTATAQLLPPPTVTVGSDFFQTQTGTFFNFGPGIGIVDFAGLPLTLSQDNALGYPYLGATDTIVQRQTDAFIDTSPANTQLVALSLQSTAPVTVGGFPYNVFVGLNPSIASTGFLMINGTLAGGTFASTLDVNFEARFLPLSPVVGPFTIFGNTVLSGGGNWGPTPSNPSTLLIAGPYLDLFANCHGVGPACLVPTTAVPEVDFFPVSSVECDGPNGCHAVAPTTPEPTSLLLLGSSVVGVFWKLRGTRSARA